MCEAHDTLLISKQVNLDLKLRMSSIKRNVISLDRASGPMQAVAIIASPPQPPYPGYESSDRVTDEQTIPDRAKQQLRLWQQACLGRLAGDGKTSRLDGARWETACSTP